MSNERFKSGIGNNRGYGGSKHRENEEQANGGCLYILSNNSYCVCTIKAKEGTTIEARVSGDYVTEDGEYIIKTNIEAGIISGTSSISFIVKKGARIEYFARKTNEIASGEIIAGEKLNADNEQTVDVVLRKEIATHTIKCNGDFTITGEFVDDDGNIINRTISATNSATFKVWLDPNHNTVKISKTYYDTLSMQIQGNGTSTANLNKKKYYATLSETGEFKVNKKSEKNINATWNSWNAEEKAKAQSVRWKVEYNDFKCTSVMINNKANITYSSVKYTNGLPNSMNITFKNGHVTSRKFKTGEVYAEIE